MVPYEHRWEEKKTGQYPKASKGDGRWTFRHLSARPTNCPLQDCNKPVQGQSKRSAKDSQFDHINPPFAAFALADERLRLAQLPGELYLG
jgi:hypothetical protein